MPITQDTETCLNFSSDYLEGAHPAILEKLAQTNLDQTSGYGTDPYCASAARKILEACGAPDGEVYFLAGGTQANAVVIDALLAPYQGVLCAASGHISVHEAGAIESNGHKVLALPQQDGKITAAALEEAARSYHEDANRDHMVMPGLVYLSQPTEYGTLYSLEELTAISRVCRAYGMKLYIDGARLAYALASPANDVTLPDLARLCDVFYIGGTKCGALIGEAVVIAHRGLIPHFFSLIKQHGALLAKGRLLGIQFDVLFTDSLYQRIGENAIRSARRLSEILTGCGLPLASDSPTNQVFVTLDDALLQRLEKRVGVSFWEKPDEHHTTVRLAASWATRPEAVEALQGVLEEIMEP